MYSYFFFFFALPAYFSGPPSRGIHGLPRPLFTGETSTGFTISTPLFFRFMKS